MQYFDEFVSKYSISFSSEFWDIAKQFADNECIVVSSTLRNSVRLLDGQGEMLAR